MVSNKMCNNLSSFHLEEQGSTSPQACAPARKNQEWRDTEDEGEDRGGGDVCLQAAAEESSAQSKTGQRVKEVLLLGPEGETVQAQVSDRK